MNFRYFRKETLPVMCNCNKGRNKTRPKINPGFSASSFFKQSERKRITSPLKNKTVADESSLEDLDGETFEEKCLTFAYMLGLNDPVPENVLYSAMNDPRYAHRLLTHRNTPYLYELINNPPQKGAGFSSGDLIMKAGKALFQWGLSGFPTVSAQLLKTREDACLACPFLAEPESRLQRITASSAVRDETGYRTGNMICSSCGCVVRNKMRLKTETCPVEVKETPGINRWGEALAEKK
jgi:hypothetical protein